MQHKRIIGATVYVTFGVLILSSLLDLPRRGAEAWASLGVTMQWHDPQRQFSLRYAPASYSLITRLDTALPRDASLLLVTSGRDIWRTEYILYHRLLYDLVSRPVWWAAPVRPDGSWKSRWWTYTPLTESALLAEAKRKESTHALLVGVEETSLPGDELFRADGALLIRLDREEQQSGSGGPPSGDRYAQAAAPLRALGAIATIWAAGLPLTLWLRRRGYALGRSEAAGLMWMVGMGLCSIAMLLLSALGMTLQWQIPLLTGAVLSGLVLSRSLWLSKSSRSKPPTPNWQEGSDGARAVRPAEILVKSPVEKAVRGLLLLLIILDLLFVAARSIGGPLHVWDSWANWAIKARTIFVEGRVTDALYEDASRMVTHLDYPLLLPLLEAWLFGWVGAADDRVVGMVTFATFLALLASLYGVLRRMGVGATLALTACAVLATMDNVAGLASIAFAEVPLLLATTVAALHFRDWLITGNRGALLFALIGAGMLPWTKREGVLLLAALILAALLTHGFTRRAWVGIAALGGGAALIAGPWWALMSLSGTTNSAFLPITPETLAANLPRLETILVLTWEGLTSTGFGLLWPMSAVIAPVALMAGFRRREDTMLLLFVALYLLLSLTTYLFSAFVPYEDHVISSARRLAAEVTPVLVAWLALLVPSTSNSTAPSASSEAQRS
jgi:hypothetical protein